MGETARSFFSDTEKENIKNAIRLAELETSGEIRVHVEYICKGDPKDRAAEIFTRLNMHHTKERNRVLFYLALKNRKFAIIGDAGINGVVPKDFWDKIRNRMLLHFRESNFTEGLTEAIRMAGENLKKHFPFRPDNMNELPDDISFGSN